MMVLGTVLLYALFAGAFAWGVQWVLGRLGAAGWLITILGYAALVYAFWFLVSNGPIQIGR